MDSRNSRLAKSTLNLSIVLEVIALGGLIVPPPPSQLFEVLSWVGVTVFAFSAFFAFRWWHETRIAAQPAMATVVAGGLPAEPLHGVAVRDALSEHYVRSFDWAVPKGKLPDQEIEVRHAITKWRGALVEALSVSTIEKLLRPVQARKKVQIADKSERELRALVASSREHRAALCRMVNITPADNPVQRMMASFLADITKS
jgi:hypothetical protein